MKTLNAFLAEATNVEPTAIDQVDEEAVNESTDIELKPHSDGKSYIVHKVHEKSGIKPDQLKSGEKITDTHVDDLHDLGYTVKIHKK